MYLSQTEQALLSQGNCVGSWKSPVLWEEFIHGIYHDSTLNVLVYIQPAPYVGIRITLL